MNWTMTQDGASNQAQFLPSVTLGSSLMTSLGGKPLLWNMDCVCYLYGDSVSQANQAEVDVNTGAEWRRWDNFYIRAGINALPFNSDIFRDRTLYALEFNPRVTAGFAYNSAQLTHRRMWCNYAVSMDGAGAGLDQRLDLTMSF